MNITRFSSHTICDIRQRCEAASPPPWTPYVERRDHVGCNDFIAARGGVIADLNFRDIDEGTIDFIARAREDIPWLLGLYDRITDPNRGDPRAECEALIASRLKQVRAALHGAMPPPWHWDEKYGMQLGTFFYEVVVKVGDERTFVIVADREEDREFALHAHADVEALLETLEPKGGADSSAPDR